MRDGVSIDAPCGYVLTSEGRDLLEEHEACACERLLVINGQSMCTECGTVYGVVYGFNKWYVRGSRRRHAQ